MSKPVVLKKKKDGHNKAPYKREGKRISFATADPNPGFPSCNKLLSQWIEHKAKDHVWRWRYKPSWGRLNIHAIVERCQTWYGWWLGKKRCVQLYTSEQTITESLSLSIVGWKRVLDLWVWRSLFPTFSQMFSRNMQLVSFWFFFQRDKRSCSFLIR